MSNTLQDAIAAARAGDMARAQMLAADAVSHNPDDPNGWYLLSQVVDSDARRAAYLSKTLALAPDHPRARAEFAALPPAVVADLSPAAVPQPLMVEPQEPERIVVEAAELPEPIAAPPAEALPAADLPDDGLPSPDEMIDYLDAAPFLAAEPAAEPVPEAAPEVPEWLQPLSPEPVAMQATPVSPVAPFGPPVTTTPAPPRPAPRPTPARRSNTGNRALSIMLGLLAVLTVIVLAFLIYLLFF